jgi:hypothetical protein
MYPCRLTKQHIPPPHTHTHTLSHTPPAAIDEYHYQGDHFSPRGDLDKLAKLPTTASLCDFLSASTAAFGFTKLATANRCRKRHTRKGDDGWKPPARKDLSKDNESTEANGRITEAKRLRTDETTTAPGIADDGGGPATTQTTEEPTAGAPMATTPTQHTEEPTAAMSTLLTPNTEEPTGSSKASSATSKVSSAITGFFRKIRSFGW